MLWNRARARIAGSWLFLLLFLTVAVHGQERGIQPSSKESQLSTTTLTSSASTAAPGQLVTLTATVSTAKGAANGTVEFTEGANVLGVFHLVGGVATAYSSTLSSGTIVATYSGSGNIPGSSASLVQTVEASPGGIQPEFFGMAFASSSQMPRISYGMFSHPPGAWTSIEGAGRGIYNFSSIDALVLNAPKDENGVALVDLAMNWTPGWAVADQSKCILQKSGFLACTVPPDNIQDWVDFITALINHYNGITAPHIKYYEIWNEANSPSFWTGGVPSLINMGQLAYAILKTDPYSYVLTPSVVWKKGSGPTFMASYLAGGGSTIADGVTFHSYTSVTGAGVKTPVPWPESSTSTNTSIENMITTYRQVADSNGMEGMPLMTTEGGWGVLGVVDPDQQSAWIAHYEIVQAGLASANNLIFQSWWEWGDPQIGVIRNGSDGTPTQAGEAYQQVYSWLVNSVASPCNSASGIWSCPVSANLIVWDDSQTCNGGSCTTSTYAPPAGYSRYVDLTGAVTPIAGTIPLGVKPIMLEP
jgi:Bacterial Ig-like domain (group 3)